jgi:O-antigen ligase
MEQTQNKTGQNRLAPRRTTVSTNRPAASDMRRPAPVGGSGPAMGALSPHNRALVILIIAVVGLAIFPSLVLYLQIEHRFVTMGVRTGAVQQVPLERFVRLAAATALLLTCSAIVLMRGHPNRSISGAMILLLGLAFPYIISSRIPQTTEIVEVALAVVVILAVWNIKASVEGLKWLPITGSLIGAGSIIGGLIAPKYMMYFDDSTKAIIGKMLLAGPFGHSNILGAYCVLALALIPLIASLRWKILNGLVLCATIVASASRTALIAAGLLLLWWWITSRFRSVINVRLAGTVLVGCCAAIAAVLPLLSWSRDAFSGRGYIWAEGLSAWQESPLLGMGINWFRTTSRSSASVASWAQGGSGHNIVVDTLVTLGLAGICLLVLVLSAAIRSIRTFEVTSHQIACFGYLIAFLVLSITEAYWTLLPTSELFPVVGFVLAVIIVTTPDRC